jgi:uracil-DNA glycosylase family 4
VTCTLCPLHRDAYTVCVASRGSETPTILIVGQNPGKEEDLNGQAFVGKSGRLLDAMLADAGFSPDEYRLSNAVRCITPDNRAPLPKEIAACSTHLEAEITALRPQVIIALGEVALRALVGPRALSSVRGQELELHPRFAHRCPVFATYHPSWVLRAKSASARPLVTSDLARVGDRGTPQTEVRWQPWRGEPLTGTIIAYDIETYDEQGKITDLPTQVAVATESGTYVTVTRLRELLQAIVDFDGIRVGHNSFEFDLPKIECYLK